MPGPEQLIRTVVGLPWAIARRVIGLGAGLLQGSSGPTGADERAPRRDERVAPRHGAATPDVDPTDAAAEALERERDPAEEAIFTPDDDFFEEEHVESEVELVAESADVDATEPPGPQLHVDEPWEGYRRMKVAEITAQLDGQPPEVLAAVELYETTHRNRRGVLDAVRAASRG